MKRKQRILLLLCLLLALTPMVSAEGNQATDAAMARLHTEVPNAALSMNVDIGYGNAVTYGKYIPATVVITNTGADFSGSLCLNLYQNNIDYDRVEVSLEVASGASKRVVLPIKLQRKQSVFTFELVENEMLLWELKSALCSTLLMLPKDVAARNKPLFKINAFNRFMLCRLPIVTEVQT